MLLWEIQKIYIKGTVIKLGTHLKREITKQIDTLLQGIHNIEVVHKQSLASSVLAINI